MEHKELHLKLTIRLYTDDNQRSFGPGIATLLERNNAYVADVEAYCQGKFEESFGFYRDLNQR